MVLDKMSNAPGVLIKDPEAVSRKLNIIKDGGHDNLQIVTDFDQTLTAYHMPDGSRVCPCYGLVEQSRALLPELATRLAALVAKYYPIEVDHSISHDEKLKHMESWWKSSNQAFVDAKFNKKMIPEIVASANCRFREGFDEFLTKTMELDIPCCILSAGLADLIRCVLEQHLKDVGGLTKYTNVHIISNLMDFDEEGTLLGFKGEVIHVLNKKEVAIADTEFGQQTLKRHNLILMGDSLGDVQMSEGIEHANIIKIGYLNIKAAERKDDFMNVFDIVILNDGDMSVPNYILDLASEGW